jgi:pantoate ligase/cytidylate kinase
VLTGEATSKGFVVALDGPASSGKSSVGAAAAALLGYRFCDTGLLYRAVTWLALRKGVSPEDASALVGLVPEVELLDVGDGRLAHVSVDGIDQTSEVHAPEVDAAVSAVSRVPELRAALLARQREIVDGGRIIMAGRDIGTVVLPDADLKLFLDASVEERARRRSEERGLEPGSPEADEVLADMRRRDELDSTRTVAPLRRADDAVVIRTDGNAFETTVGLVVEAVRQAEAAAGSKPRAVANATAPRKRQSRTAAKPTPIASKIPWFAVGAAAVLRTIARLILRIRFEGEPGAVPREGPVIVVSNHASSADPVLIGAFLLKWQGRALNWLGKRELVETPVIGWAMRQVPIHPVDREAADMEAFRTAKRILDSGNILAIFPEGTRSRDGALQSVRDGAGVLALMSGAPVVPVGVIDSDQAWPRGSLMPKFGKHVIVRYGAPFRVADDPAVSGAPNRRKATEAATRLIMTRIAELLPPRQRGIYANDVENGSGSG